MFNQYALLNVGPMIKLIHILQCTRPYIDSFETKILSGQRLWLGSHSWLPYIRVETYSSKSGIFEGADSGLRGGESTHKLVNIIRMSGVL